MDSVSHVVVIYFKLLGVYNGLGAEGGQFLVFSAESNNCICQNVEVLENAVGWKVCCRRT